jgi:hypothetical protein
VVGGTWLIANQAFGGTKAPRWSIIAGLFGIANLTVLFLPVLRGYYLYASHDALGHIGMGLDVARTGHVGTDNVYPAVHVLVAQLSQICGLAPVSVGRLLPVILNLVFAIMLTYLVGEASLPELGQRLLTFAFASAFLLNSLHVMLYSQVLSFFFVLLALYLRLNKAMSQRLAGKIALIIVLFVIPYSHPTPSLMTVFFLLVIELADDSYRRRKSGRPAIGQIPVNLPLISAITFFTWISSFVLFDVKVSTLWANLRDPFAAPHVEALENAIGEISVGSAVSTFLKMYGDSVLCLLLAIVGALMVIKSMRSGKKELSNTWILTMVFLASVPVQLLIFTGAGSQTVGRLVNLNFAIFLSPILAAYALHQLLRWVGKATAIVVSSVLLLTVWVVGMLGLYHSPWILQPSWQITRMNAQGIQWFFQNKDNGVLFSAMGYPYGTQYTTYGYRAAFSREDYIESLRQMIYDIERVLPIGFGYDRFATLGESMNQDRYLMIAKRFQIAAADPTLSSQGLKVVPLFWRDIQLTDLARLEDDPSADKLYSNGELDVWYVNVWPRGD